MNPRRIIHGIDIGSCGRVLHPAAADRGIVRASDIALSPVNAISVVIIL